MSVLKDHSRHQLFRNPEQKVFFGVCSGIADYFGLRTQIVRAVFVASLILSAGWTLIIYLFLSAILKNRPKDFQYSREESEFWRNVSFNPRETYSGIQSMFDRIERRIGKIETYVTSKSYDLNQQFADLEEHARKSARRDSPSQNPIIE